jgi:hypothetical protein
MEWWSHNSEHSYLCLLALELLPLVIDVFQQSQRLKRIKWLKWFTVLFFGLFLATSIVNIMYALTLPQNVILTMSFLLLLWPNYAGVLQMTILITLLNFLTKQAKKLSLNSSEASIRLMRTLRAMIYLNVVGIIILGFGLMNFLYAIIQVIPPQWNIILIMVGFNIFFVMLTLLAFFIFNVKSVVNTNGAMTSTDVPSSVSAKQLTNKSFIIVDSQSHY